ncbi:MAG: IS66 family transposase [Sulfuricaulis sp.]|uniref:IS66 family transposase n=1 Tax=Sulfuricaulis sp. TaxID=2003553 RepID=UPI0034A44786
MQTLPDLSKLSHAQKDDLIRLLWPLIEEVRQLKARVAELEARLAKDSHNSHKPPSSDGLKKTHSQRESSGKAPGGQAGHKGTGLKRVSVPDTVIEHRLPEYCVCGARLNAAYSGERRQVFDIPVAQFNVTEHRTWQARCRCGREHQSAFADGVNQLVQYGPNLKALAVHLTQGQLLPLFRTAQLIEQLFGLPLSAATVHAWIGEAARRLAPAVARIGQALVASPVAHADESGLRVAAKLHWLHTVASPTLTWYGVHARRGAPAMQAHAILPHRSGVLVHDCWGPYWQMPGEHALCNAHLIRELIYLHETTGQVWPKRLIRHLRRARDHCEAARREGHAAVPDRLRRRIERRYAAILAQAQACHPPQTRTRPRRGRIKQSVAHNLTRRLSLHAAAVLRFVSDLTVPFTNNLGERAIRMPKVKQKISGSFRTLKGAEDFCIIRSYLDTLHKQGHNVFQALRSAFIAQPIAACPD